jgi:vacuolar-type H+-ATPase subunit I/STV1
MSDQRLDIESFTEEERQEIYNQIEDISRRSSISVDKQTFEYTPRKKGGTFPLMVNILAVLTIAGVILFSSQYFQAREAAMSEEATGYLSTEGRLLEELKKESDRKIGEKEQEIDRIQQELSQIDQERAALESSMEERIQQKEVELQSALDLAIEEERNRLRALGVTTEEVDRQIEAFRREQESRYQQQLVQFRQESEAALNQKQKELEEAKSFAQQILDQATAEREELLADNLQREEELRSRFEEQRQTLEAATSEAKSKLQAMAQARQNEQLLLDQITSAYRATLDAIQSGDQVTAAAELEKLRTILRSETADALAAVRNRRPVDLYLADLLEGRIQTLEASSAESPDSGLIEAARKVAAARQAAARGDESLGQGNVEEAAAFYDQALGFLPAIRGAADELARLRSEARAARAREYREIAEETLAAGDREAGIESLNSALLESASASDATRLSASETLARLAELKAVETAAAADLKARLAESRNAVQELNSRIAELVSERDSLREQAGQAEEKISELENELSAAAATSESLGRDLAAQRQELFSTRSSLERARGEVAELQNDLDEAVDQLASLVSLSESDRTLSRAVSRYQQTGTGEVQSQEDADLRLRQLLGSSEIRALFPGINTILEKSSIGQDQLN